MPHIVLHKNGQVHAGEVKENSNLVVRAGIRQFPFPYLRYECGMGKCAKCACRILAGGEHLPPPNWKEKKQLGERLASGYRLTCQLWINQDLELAQDDNPPA
jgi:ferredoxin